VALPAAAPAANSFQPLADRERLGEFLVREGLVTREQVVRGLAEQQASGMRLGYCLVKLGSVAEVELTKALARQFRMPAVDLSRFEPDARVVKLVPADLALRHLVLPLKREGRTLTVAIADPANPNVLEDLKFITRYDVFPVVAGEYTLRALVEKFYDAGEQQQVQSQLQSLVAEFASDEAAGDVEVLESGEDDGAGALGADEAPVVRLVNAILMEAVKRGASDVHIECFEHELRVRFRVDGALADIMSPPVKLRAALISRLKILASLNIAERRVPQDGRIKLKMGKKVVDFRVSTLPTLFGEKVVLRILDKGNLALDLDTFGLEPRAERELADAIANPYGMVLVTGPTGSGKTTTLYSALARINTGDVNIMTAEDPVEYNLFGINQVQVRTEVGMTFAAALKAFLRQDPNVIMVGEIRDLETGGIAVKAALTGHLVLSTLHTNSAPETVTRLLDMGLEPFNVSSALNLVLAQRLVRRVCAKCKQRHAMSAADFAAAKVKPETRLRDLRFSAQAVEDAKGRATAEAAPLLAGVTVDTPVGDLPYFKGAGCEACNGTGLKGRQGLYEVMAMTPRIRRQVLTGADAAQIRETAVEEGMLTLRMDGWLKVLKGVTTLEQVVRETGA
jgi:type IV pilus assembly protein PilB